MVCRLTLFCLKFHQFLSLVLLIARSSIVSGCERLISLQRRIPSDTFSNKLSSSTVIGRRCLQSGSSFSLVFIQSAKASLSSKEYVCVDHDEAPVFETTPSAASIVFRKLLAISFLTFWWIQSTLTSV